MEELFYVPKGRHWAIPFMAAGTLWVMGWSMWKGEPTAGWMLVTALALVVTGWGLVNFVHHVSVIFGEERRKSLELEYRFSPNYLAETLARMNADQLKAVRAGKNLVDIVPTDRGRVEMIRGEEVYLYTAWFILVNSTKFNVYPINRFKQETYHFDVLGDMSVDDYTQAKNFHRWLYKWGAANWGHGNMSMTWNEGWSAEKVMEGLGLDQDSFEE